MAHNILVGSLEHGLHLGVGVVASVGHNSLGVGMCQSVVDHLKGLYDVAGEQSKLSISLVCGLMLNMATM